jgi:hypothetical protein
MGHRCNCDACVADPAFTCSYMGDDVTVEAVYIANAYRGNLILCPGGANGQIGGLLHQLDPPQHYSHMGIFVTDHELVRNCTASPERLTSDEYYTGSALGVSAPVDGLNVDHLQWGWPGTITQSAEQIFFADRYGDALTPPGLAGPYTGSKLVDRESPSQKAYSIAAVSFDGVYDGGEWFPAIVVKPCPALETPELTAALERVADEALKINAHYRFYCYTDGAIGNDLNYHGHATEVVAAMPEWDLDSMKWKDWSDPAEVKWESVGDTYPAVCSSFVWQAVQNANKAAPPKIILDWAESHAESLAESGGNCRRAVRPDWNGDVHDSFTLDGLYTYDEASRARAAQWLNDSLSDEVFNSLKKALTKMGGVGEAVAKAIDLVGRVAFIAAAAEGSLAVLSLLTPVVGPIVAVAITVVFVEQLIELLYEMPNTIANQVCNSFAFDCHRGFPADTHCLDGAGNEIRDVDSTNWADDPGIGRAVSPDNIHMFWDAPGRWDERISRGLYGYNTPAQLVVAAVKRPRCELVARTGTAVVRGFVWHGHDEIIGATVQVNCQKAVTRSDLGYHFLVGAGGRYKLIARYEDPRTGLVLYGEATTPPLAPNQNVGVDIHLLEPPECLRNVVVEGVVRVDDVYLTGADHAQTQFRKPLYVQYGVPAFNEASGTWDIDPADPAGAARQHDVASVNAAVGAANGGLTIEVTANGDLSVDVTFTGTLGNLSAQRSVYVPAGGVETVAEFSLDSGGPFNERAYFRGLTITNQATSAI